MPRPIMILAGERHLGRRVSPNCEQRPIGVPPNAAGTGLGASSSVVGLSSSASPPAL
jgi:hypothetical protein